MLLSLLLTLTPTTSTTLEDFYGRQVQGWFLGLIAQHAPGLADQLHSHSRMRPYTVSSLIVPQGGPRGENGQIHLIPGKECQLRITTLSGELSELLLAKIVPGLPQKLRLKSSEFKELRLAKQNQWDGESSYQGLVDQAWNSRGDSVTLEFASPTAFRLDQIDQTLPTPDLVWSSLYRRWNTFAPEPLHIDALWPEFARRCLVVSDYQLRSKKVAFEQGARGAATGAVGKATYRLLPAKHCGEYAPIREGAAAILRTLAAFSLYAGIGHHTTIGLGQTRWISQQRQDVP